MVSELRVMPTSIWTGYLSVTRLNASFAVKMNYYASCKLSVLSSEYINSTRSGFISCSSPNFRYAFAPGVSHTFIVMLTCIVFDFSSTRFTCSLS